MAGNLHNRIAFILILLAVVLTADGVRSADRILSADPGQLVRIRMQNARVLTGYADAQSDDRQLVLRGTSANVVLRTRVPWEHVRSAIVADSELSAQQLRQQWTQIVTPGPPSMFRNAALTNVRSVASEDGHTAIRNSVGGLVTVSGSPDRLRNSPDLAVRSLQFSTQPANWDADAAIDGLQITVVPTDRWGRLVAVDGQLDLNLLGLTHSPGGQAQPGLSPVEFPVLETWTQTVRRSDFTSAGAFYRLEYRKLRPDIDTDVVPLGLLSGRLTVPGTGTFAASEEVTVFRPYSPLRDLHQMFRGTRTLPPESRD